MLKGIEKKEDIVLTGFVEGNNLKLLKLPDSFKFDPAYCTTMRNGNFFEGYFGFVSTLPKPKHQIYSSIEKTFENINKGNYLVDKITSELIENLRQNYFKFSKTGSCIIKFI